MKLFEIFNRDAELTKTRDTKYMWQVRADVGGRPIVFTAETLDHDNVWSVNFLEIRKNGRHTYDSTGSGAEFEVGGMVLKALKMFIEERKPGLIVFTANKTDGNRASLYGRVLKRTHIPGYTARAGTPEDRKYLHIQNEVEELYVIQKDSEKATDLPETSSKSK
jgi:hypothetical protein